MNENQKQKPPIIDIIICTEEGPLENMSILLVESFRLFGEIFESINIYSYQPRSDYKISVATQKFFKNNGVNVIDEVLNTDFKEYPLANKPLACAHREKQSRAEYLLFLDSDTFFCGFPQLLLDGLDDMDVSLGPVDFNTVGTDMNFSSGEGFYWKSIYSLLGAVQRKEVQTRVDRSRILEYYNSGFILVRREVQLFQKWLENFQIVMEKGLQPRNGLFFVEQSCLSATIVQLNLRVSELQDSYNYPIGAFAKKWRGFYPYSLKKIKHVHYHKLFRNSLGLNPIRNKLINLVHGDKMIELIDKHLLIN